MGAYAYSATAASNTSVDGIGAQGSDSPDNIDNLVRALAASDAALVRDLGGANTVAGTADAITVALADPTAATAYFDGMRFSFRAASDSTAVAPTLNVDTIGAKTIAKAVAGVETALVAGDIQAGGTYDVVYRSAWASAVGAFELLNPEGHKATVYPAVTVTAANQLQARTNISAALRGHIWGLTLSNNGSDATNDIDIAAGEAASTETSPVLMILASALTKRLDAAWAVGTNQGGLDTGSIANTTYHVWLIQRSDTGVVDALFSTSASSPTMPTNYDRKRRIGSIIRTSGAILGFSQSGNEFLFTADCITDVSAANPGNSVVNRTLTVPAGITVHALLSARIVQSTSVEVLLSIFSPVTTTYTGFMINATPNGSNARDASSVYPIRTNTSSQVSTKCLSADANTTINIFTMGWIDTRGKDA